ncbi:hypothetical protein [Flavobacterium columnare]|uniref:hypothetical protein n=1 Tax=Flavobacterium columnare TaxID=996 RepID=UPI002989E02F|nr:hypothetical protein [Flavobacterium columnare]MCH4829159.1 hypothetical protein [Flavobacterium columnare]MCH4833935.1 hypothetical protein [Flavobacterium columnare]
MNDILPNGTEIRDLLSNSFLTTTHINKLLKEKRIITQNTDKNTSFPIYMSLLLSPNEFNYLYEKNSDKEEKEKIKSVLIPIDENIELADLCLDLNIKEILNENLTYTPNYEIIGVPYMVIDKDEINLDIVIKTTSNIKGWSSRESFHKASLSLKKENDRLIGTKTFTSKDSEKVIDFAIGNYEDKLKEKKYFKKDKKISRILFKNFDNVTRFNFIYSFANDFKNIMTFDEITDISILPDDSKIDDIPTELKEFLNNVNDLNLKGKKLQDHVFITQIENRKFIQLKSIKLKYKFDKIGCDGNCVIEFEFPEKTNMESSEFQFNISNLSISKKDKELISNSSITKKINTALNKHKLEKFEDYRFKEE